MSANIAPRQTTDVARANNPFAGAPVVAQPTSAGIAAVNARELAEIHGQMQIARMNPRNPVQAMDRILNAFARPGLAETGMYEYSRGGDVVTGLSIRAAEAIAQHWGNIRTGVKELSRANGQSEVQTYAWDLETGFYSERTFHVKHWRDTRKGGYQITDERDIYELVANMGARRQRACILAAIPDDVKAAAEKQIHTTMRASIEVTPDSIQKMAAYFESEFGVTKAMIEQRIQRRIDSIVPAQMLQLKRIVQSLKDGMGTVADFFQPDEAAAATDTSSEPNKAGTQGVKDRLKGKTQAATAKPSQTAPAQEAESTADDGAHYTDATAMQAIKSAGSVADLKKVWEAISIDYSQTQRDVPVSIEAHYMDRMEALQQRQK